MKNECKIEFYFKRDEMEKLLKNNPTAKAIIICQQLVKSPTGALAKITAYALKNETADATTREGDDEDIPGCPYPPGC